MREIDQLLISLSYNPYILNLFRIYAYRYRALKTLKVIPENSLFCVEIFFEEPYAENKIRSINLFIQQNIKITEVSLFIPRNEICRTSLLFSPIFL